MENPKLVGFTGKYGTFSGDIVGKYGNIWDFFWGYISSWEIWEQNGIYLYRYIIIQQISETEKQYGINTMEHNRNTIWEMEALIQ